MKHNYHLKRNEDFQAVIQRKQSISASAFVVYGMKSDQPHTRIGLSVTKKLGIAVVRNHIKRQVRMMCDDIFTYDQPYDWVIIVRKPFLDEPFATNARQLNQLVSQLQLRLQEKL